MAEKMTGEELVAFARSKMDTPYVYGMKGKVLTQKQYAQLKQRYGAMVWDSDAEKIGKVCVDCSGLISWAIGVARSSAQWCSKASKKKSIKTIKDAPIGAMVWMKGHIGIYTGMKDGVPYYIAADGSAYGVREVPLSYNKFTHWLLDEELFDYGDDEVVKNIVIQVDGLEYTVSAINKDGYTYIKTRDIASVCGYNVSNKGETPILTKKK